jgi:hypothetical protein
MGDGWLRQVQAPRRFPNAAAFCHAFENGQLAQIKSNQGIGHTVSTLPMSAGVVSHVSRFLVINFIDHCAGNFVFSLNVGLFKVS